MPSQDSALERFVKHFQKSSARGELCGADNPQLFRANKIVEQGDVSLGLKKVTLQGKYDEPPNTTDTERQWGKCLSLALQEAMHVEVTNLPDVVRGQDLPSICVELGLKLITDKRKYIPPLGQDIMIFYQQREETVHVIVTRDIKGFKEKYSDRKILAVVETPPKQSI